MRKLLLCLGFPLFLTHFTTAQVGINTENPQNTLDINGHVQLRNELRINNDPGTAGQVYFSQGASGTLNDWKNVSVPFLEDGQYQLVSTYAKRDQVGIDWVGSISACTVSTFPFTENFEDSSLSRSCWTNEFVTGTTPWTYAAGAGAGSITTDNTAGTANVLNARFTSTTAQTTRLVSPVFNLTTINTPRMTFFYGQEVNASAQNQLRIYYRTSAAGAWVQIPPAYTTSIAAWTQVTVFLPNKSATYQVAFEGVSNGGRPNVIDDVVISEDASVIKNFPFTETFEDSSPTRANWTQAIISGSANWTYGAGSNAGNITVDTTPDPGTLNARFVITSGSVTRLITPVMDLTGIASPRLRFNYAQQVGAGQNSLRVYYRTSPSSAWTLITSTGVFTTAANAWTPASIVLPSPSSTYQIAFEGTTPAGFTGFATVIDDVTVDSSTAPCSTVQAFPFTENFEVTSSSRPCWTSVPVTGSTQWVYAEGAGGGTPTTDNTAAPGIFNARFLAAANQVGRLTSPLMNLSGMAAPRMSFFYAQAANGAGQNQLRVYYRTTANGAWTLIPSATYLTSITGWTQLTLTLPNPSATYQIAFEGTTSTTPGRANVIDDVVIFDFTPPTIPSGYDASLSTLGEAISAKSWVRIPGLDLPVTIKNGSNKIALTFQTGVESRINTTTADNTTLQTSGYIRYMCGLFRRLASQPVSASTLVALRANQIDNYAQKTNNDKAQSLFTLNYVVENIPAESYVFSTACRRLSLFPAGTETSSLFSVGNTVNSGSNQTSDFMMNSVIKMDIIELVIYSN